MTEDEDRYQRVNLRLPKGLHAKLQSDADQKSRSMNAEIVTRLEASFTAPGAEMTRMEQAAKIASAHAVRSFVKAIVTSVDAGTMPAETLAATFKRMIVALEESEIESGPPSNEP